MSIDEDIDCDVLVNDDKAYRLLKDTWIGQKIATLATLREHLEKKFASVIDNEEDDFFALYAK